MSKPRQVGLNEDKIVTVLSNTNTALSGCEIRRVTGIWPLSVYQALGKLEELGVITSEWGNGSYRRRRLYRRSGS